MSCSPSWPWASPTWWVWSPASTTQRPSSWPWASLQWSALLWSCSHYRSVHTDCSWKKCILNVYTGTSKHHGLVLSLELNGKQEWGILQINYSQRYAQTTSLDSYELLRLHLKNISFGNPVLCVSYLFDHSWYFTIPYVPWSFLSTFSSVVLSHRASMTSLPVGVCCLCAWSCCCSSPSSASSSATGSCTSSMPHWGLCSSPAYVSHL